MRIDADFGCNLLHVFQPIDLHRSKKPLKTISWPFLRWQKSRRSATGIIRRKAQDSIQLLAAISRCGEGRSTGRDAASPMLAAAATAWPHRCRQHRSWCCAVSGPV